MQLEVERLQAIYALLAHFCRKNILRTSSEILPTGKFWLFVSLASLRLTCDVFLCTYIQNISTIFNVYTILQLLGELTCKFAGKQLELETGEQPVFYILQFIFTIYIYILHFTCKFARKQLEVELESNQLEFELSWTDTAVRDRGVAHGVKPLWSVHKMY